MRTLLLMTGAPGSGKTTFLKENNLLDYTLSPDNLRRLFNSAKLNVDGTYGISQENDNEVWKLLFSLLRKRMSKGEFTAIDATLSKKSDFNKIKKMVKEYRYRVYTVSFRDIDLNTLIERNKHRGIKNVPENVIRKMVNRFQDKKNSIPKWANEIHYKDFDKSIFDWREFNADKYNKVYFIGDIHGSYTVLMDFFKKIKGNPADNPNDLFVFLGDYIDRGIENHKVIEYLISIKDLENVILLEGNHEINLWKWSNNKIQDISSSKFLKRTSYQLETNSIRKKQVRELYRKFQQVVKIKKGNYYILATHGGVPIFDINVINISSRELIHGVGNYKESDDLADYWNRTFPETLFLVHGHRNIFNRDVQNGKVFNLEGKVEYGGYLRIVEFSNSIKTYEIKNNIYVQKENLENIFSIDEEIKSLLSRLSLNKDIIKKDFNNISSFKVKPNIFFKKSWKDIPLKIRGLFLNSQEIVARGYNKILYFNENKSSAKELFFNDKKYPAQVFLKENGFLGLLGYDSETDSLIYTSKSVVGGDYAKIFKKTLGEINTEYVKKYLKENNLNLIFEVIHSSDPHIIDYKDKNEAILLDAVKRQLDFNPISYKELLKLGKKLNLKVKSKISDINNPSELIEIENKIKYSDLEYEGAVIQFNDFSLIKIKTNYYIQWKKLRRIKDKIANKQDVKEPFFENETFLKFYFWMKNLDEDMLSKSIVELRRIFLFIKKNKSI